MLNKLMYDTKGHYLTFIWKDPFITVLIYIWRKIEVIVNLTIISI